jgi:hypothetical protein
MKKANLPYFKKILPADGDICPFEGITNVLLSNLERGSRFGRMRISDRMQAWY